MSKIKPLVTTLTVGWFCITQWQPGREAELPDYLEATEEHIAACAAVGR